MGERYWEIEFEVSGEAQEVLIWQLENIGFESFWQEERSLKGYILQTLLAEDTLKETLQALCAENQINYQMIEMPQQNWNAIWEANYEPVAVADFCFIYPDFHATDPAYVYNVAINPQMSFGTGHHETTRLMVQQMKDIHFADKKVLDMGCGAGILGILAAKMGAAQVLCIDIEENAVQNTLENASRNQLSHKILAQLGAVENIHSQIFDIILANINRNVLLADGEQYVAALANEGLLVLSGFFDFDTNQIIDYFTAKNLTVLRVLSENGWDSVCFTK